MPLVIPYGGARDDTGPSISIDAACGTALRLSDLPYPFPEPPDLFRLASREARLDFLRDHLKSLCGLWNRLPLAFLDAYFRYILFCLDEKHLALTAMAEELGGLFEPRDWCFAALRPLPQAQLFKLRVDFAFWTGAQLVAVELIGSATPTRQRREEWTQLRTHGVEVVELSGACLDAASLAMLLPPSFSNFWTGVMPPSSPFAPTTLAEILPPG